MNRKIGLLIVAALAAVAAVVIPLTTASGGTDHRSATVAAADSATIRTARCSSWNQMDEAHREGIIAGMREFFTGHLDIPKAWGTGLQAADAMKLFDGYCKPSFAQNFRLYRLYGDAATFTPTK